MRRTEAGFGLLETLVAMTILSIAVVVLVGGMGTGVIRSDLHRKQADGNAVLLQAAEAVKADTVAHIQCATVATAGPYETAARAVDLPPGWNANNITVTKIQWYDGGSFVPSTGVCPHQFDLDNNLPIVRTLQLITLEVRSPAYRRALEGSTPSTAAYRDTEKFAFVKGKP